MSENHPTTPQNEAPSPNELRIKQFEDELASRERITQAAEKEINRVWESYSRITKLSAVFLILAGGVVAFLGIKTFSDIRDEAKKAATEEVAKMREEAKTAVAQEVQKTRDAVRKELDEQFSSDAIKQLIADKAKERIDLVVVPVVSRLIATNFETMLPALGKVIATNFSAWEKDLYANTVEQTISGTDSNRVAFLKFKDGVTKIFIRIDNCAIEQSVKATVYGPNGSQARIPNFGNQDNVIFTYFTPNVDPTNAMFVISYARDSGKTNIFKKVEVIDNQVFMDGIHIFFPQDDNNLLK
jgi:hypothetical protein